MDNGIYRSILEEELGLKPLYEITLAVNSKDKAMKANYITKNNTQKHKQRVKIIKGKSELCSIPVPDNQDPDFEDFDKLKGFHSGNDKVGIAYGKALSMYARNEIINYYNTESDKDYDALTSKHKEFVKLAGDNPNINTLKKIGKEEREKRLNGD